ncbi:transcription termination factor NusA [Lyticum sinuosum]|uniref:Transcription termination/antitermination protein NusA n=1 Tax=Lyticum sinuosum TaxID=1332059 RepID=A0AAE4VM91_9RICK|nr:transcription termination factor NusA [Lyticum sinuosum]MDZ5761383.1 Transcription termination/antitermination protein NusA [Lyticum sinuosum]
MAISNKAWDSVEILQVIESFSRENGMSKEAVFCSLEETIAIFAKKQYGNNGIIIKIDRNNGDLKIFNELIVISDEDMENIIIGKNKNFNKDDSFINHEINNQLNEKEYNIDDVLSNRDHNHDPNYIHSGNSISLSEALILYPNAKVNDRIKEVLQNIEFNNATIQSAKKILSAKINDIRKKIERDSCQHRIGEIFSGMVTHINNIGLYLQTNHGNAIIKRNNLLKTDHHKIGDRIKACLIEIDSENHGPQLILSRTSDEFLIQLMKNEIPEIYNKIIRIMGVSRYPGIRSKVAVFSSDSNTDAVGSCIGIKGLRIKSIMKELGDEKIDIVHWSDNPAQYLINCIQPIQPKKIVIYEDKHSVDVILDNSHLSSVIGRRGQNINLISKLLGWSINITDEENYSNRRLNDFNRMTTSLMSRLDIEEILAQLLVVEGYDSVNKIAESKPEVLSQIEGLDQEVAEELILRSKEYLSTDVNSELNVENTSMSDTELSNKKEQKINKKTLLNVMKMLSFSGIKSIYDLASLSSDELIQILDKYNYDISEESAREIISNARNKAYFSFAK